MKSVNYLRNVLGVVSVIRPEGVEAPLVKPHVKSSPTLRVVVPSEPTKEQANLLGKMLRSIDVFNYEVIVSSDNLQTDTSQTDSPIVLSFGGERTRNTSGFRFEPLQKYLDDQDGGLRARKLEAWNTLKKVKEAILGH